MYPPSLDASSNMDAVGLLQVILSVPVADTDRGKRRVINRRGET